MVLVFIIFSRKHMGTVRIGPQVSWRVLKPLPARGPQVPGRGNIYSPPPEMMPSPYE